LGRLEELNRINGFGIFDVRSAAFRTYGRVLAAPEGAVGAEAPGDPGLAELFRYMEERTEIPDEGNIYVASDPELEKIESIAVYRNTLFGGLDVQAGYCNGRNTTVNGFEYHKSPEVNIAVTDFLLALGHSYDISDDLSYDVDDAEIFFMPRGTVIELFGTTLHLSPLRTCDAGFRNIVILPRGTNTPLSDEERLAAAEALARGDREARLLLQKQKWVISHPEREPLIRQGAHPGVTGPNRELKY